MKPSINIETSDISFTAIYNDGQTNITLMRKGMNIIETYVVRKGRIVGVFIDNLLKEMR